LRNTNIVCVGTHVSAQYASRLASILPSWTFLVIKLTARHVDMNDAQADVATLKEECRRLARNVICYLFKVCHRTTWHLHKYVEEAAWSLMLRAAYCVLNATIYMPASCEWRCAPISATHGDCDCRRRPAGSASLLASSSTARDARSPTLPVAVCWPGINRASSECCLSQT
jgi:hypothetical protein